MPAVKQSEIEIVNYEFPVKTRPYINTSNEGGYIIKR